jgi:hypothetical protein
MERDSGRFAVTHGCVHPFIMVMDSLGATALSSLCCLVLYCAVVLVLAGLASLLLSGLWQPKS